MPKSTEKYIQGPKGLGTYEKYLQEAKFRDIAFPVSNVNTSFSQDLVQHRYPDRDGAHVESTGRAPYVFAFKAIFLNNTSRGKNETWAYGNLFPTIFNKFVSACKDRSVGKLQHPIHGTFDVKCQNISYDLNANTRDGVIADVSFIETIKNELAIKVPTAQAEAEIKALEDALNSLPTQYKIVIPEAQKADLFDALNDIKAFADTASLAVAKTLGQVDRALAKVNRVGESFRNLNNVAVSSVVSKCTMLSSTLSDIQKSAGSLTESSQERVYITSERTSLPSLVGPLRTDIISLIKLNQKLARMPIIPAGTAVRYKVKI